MCANKWTFVCTHWVQQLHANIACTPLNPSIAKQRLDKSDKACYDKMSYYTVHTLGYVTQITFLLSTEFRARLYKLHTLLLSACLHFMPRKMKFIYSIITHFSKLFPHCQHNLLPSALMAAQLWMVDGCLIGETAPHWAQERERVRKSEEKGGKIRNESGRSHLLSILCWSTDKY